MDTAKKFILFDFDGTLADTLGDIVDCINLMLEGLGQKPMTIEKIQSFVGQGLPHLIAQTLGVDDSHERVEEGIKLFHKLYEKHCTDTTVCYPGVVDFLKSRNNGSRPAVLTNKGQPYTNIIIERLGLKDFFAMVVSGDDVKERKPDPEGILTILAKMGVPAEMAVIVGDSTYDIEAGQRAGVTTVAVTYGFQPESKILPLKPDYVINSFEELKELPFI